MYIPTLWTYLLHNTYVTKLYIYQIPERKKSYVYTNIVKVEAHRKQKREAEKSIRRSLK